MGSILTCSRWALAQDPTLLVAVSGTMATVPVNPKPFLNDLTGILDELCQRFAATSAPSALVCFCTKASLVLCKLKWGALDRTSIHNASDVARARKRCFQAGCCPTRLGEDSSRADSTNYAASSQFYEPCQLKAANRSHGHATD